VGRVTEMGHLKAGTFFLVTAWLMLPSAGCGGGGERFERAEVSGTITFGGQPLREGHITFLPMGDTRGPSSTAKIIDGHYAMAEDGPVVGRHRVEIRAPRKTGKKVPDLRPENRENPDRPMIDQVVESIPVEYNTQSTLTAEIRPGKNEQNFDLTSGGREATAQANPVP